MENHQGGLKPLQWVDEEARTTWHERRKRNETKRNWVQVKDQISESEVRMMTTIIGKQLSQKCSWRIPSVGHKKVEF